MWSPCAHSTMQRRSGTHWPRASRTCAPTPSMLSQLASVGNAADNQEYSKLFIAEPA
eukprot:m.1065050 g.1065050  ORF g.1065050 m.1065050 type:complete len:57 (+) comp24218_c2_seq57:2135-2305(+)